MPRDELQSWLDMAHKDLAAAEMLLGDDDLVLQACFHAQQAVEKGLKALILARGGHVDKTHDIVRILERLEELGELFDEELQEELARLNHFAVDQRYPSPLAPPSPGEAEGLINGARGAYEEVARRIE